MNIPQVAILYRLRIGDYWYAGSTLDGMKSRINEHRKKSNKEPDRKVYKHISENGGWEKVTIELIEFFPYTSDEHLLTKEDECIKLDDPHCLNVKRAILTPDERREQKNAIKRKCWAEWTKDPEFREKQRQKKRELYARQMNDPEYVERRRQIANASYHRKKTTAVEPQNKISTPLI